MNGDRDFLLVFVTGEAEIYGPENAAGLYCVKRSLSPLEFHHIMVSLNDVPGNAETTSPKARDFGI